MTCFFDDFRNFSKTASLWNIAPRLHASSIFRVWRVREQNIFVYFGDWFLDWFGNRFLVISGWIWGLFWLPKSIKTASISGLIFEQLKNRIPQFGGTKPGLPDPP